MAVKIKSGIKLSVKIDQLTTSLAQGLKTELSDIATEIDVRTQSGKDVNEKSFAGYRPRTRAQKIKTGRLPAPVNLTQTGKMLASFGKIKMIETKNKITGIIGFGSSEQRTIAGYNQKGDSKRNRPPRKFIGLSPKQKTRLMQNLRKYMRIR